MGPAMDRSSSPRKISCKRCQLRKIRCSRTDPCTHCEHSGQDCVYRDLQSRKRPPSQEYVNGLESRVAWLESVIRSLKSASNDERDAILAATSFGDHLHPVGDQVVDVVGTSGVGLDDSCDQPQPHRHQGSVQLRSEGSAIYHGPSGIYCAMREAKSLAPAQRRGQSERDMPFSPKSDADTESDTTFSHVTEHFGIDMQGDTITDMLMHFFKWQYPHFMFVYREAFLRDHFGDRAGSKYWSTALALSMCALGALTSRDESRRSISERFFTAAETIAIVSGLAQPSITTVQTFLCLAFYEIGRGELSKAWGFSGIAFRMAQDLGFQRDPKLWVSQNMSPTTPEDIEIRRRIYWGCYCSDKIISLVLGRPAQLFHADDQVDDTLTGLPDFPAIRPWLPTDMDPEKIGDHESTLSFSQTLTCFQEQIKLSQIIERMLSSIFSARSSTYVFGRRACVDALNLELCRWQESLPYQVRCNKWEPTNSTLMMSVAAIHMLYHSCRIILHFDLVQSNQAVAASDISIDDAHKICQSAVEDILFLTRRYRGQYGLRYAPIVFIYGIVQGIRAARALHYGGGEAEYLVQALEDCSFTWALASYDLR